MTGETGDQDSLRPRGPRRASSAPKAPAEMPKAPGFWSPLLVRAQFFGQVICGLIIDGVFLIVAYLWTLGVTWASNKVAPTTGYGAVLFKITEIGLTVPTTAAVIWYVLIDLLGTIQRIWRRRNES